MDCEKQEKLHNTEKDRYMYKVKIFNKIAKVGLDGLDQSFSFVDENEESDIILLRSQNLHDYEFESSILAIGRAGAGTNNIPVKKCTEKSIPVFNTPGANANAVKELVLASMLIGSRNIFSGFNYVNSLKGDEHNIHKEVEKNKSKFKGFELQGKKLGIIGLGAIGVLVANSACSLGMEVYGYDPYISVGNAWGLSSHVQYSENLLSMLNTVDFLSIHMPLNESTKGFLNKSRIAAMKEGIIVLNFARPEIVDQDGIIDALKSNKVGKYIADFPNNKLVNIDNFIGLPHLGASTNEAEDNCAVMVVSQISDYIKNGNIVNSVNFPTCKLERTSLYRITILNNNVPNMVSQIVSKIGDENLNIIEMVNKSRGDLAYTLIDTDKEPSVNLIESLKLLDGVRLVRLLK